MQGKKSFILYSDLINVVDKLPDDKAGQLFKTVLEYVNDKNPVINDLLIQVAFEPIKLQLKRDLLDWNKEKKQRSEAGKKGMETRWKKDKSVKKPITNDNGVINPITNITDTVTVTVTDTVTVNKKNTPTESEVVLYFTENGYTEQSGKKAFRYYNDAGWKDSKGKQVKNWKQKMQGVWFKEENLQTKTNNGKKQYKHFMMGNVWFTDAEYNNHPEKSSFKPV